MRTRTTLGFVFAAAAAVLLALPAWVGAQADVVISQRQPALCNPLGSTPYLFYSVSDGKWHCTATAPSVVLGGATASAAGHAIAGLTDVSNVTSGTVQSTEYTLNTVTVPASAFNANGRGLRCTAWGTTAANANAKNIKFYFGSTAVATVTGSTANAKDFSASLTVLRTGASAQSAVSSVQVDTAVASTMATAAPTETDTAAIVIAVKSANTAAAAASASGKGLVCEFLN